MEDPGVLTRALGATIVKQMADAGDGQGLTLVHFSARRQHLFSDIWLVSVDFSDENGSS
jgi:hypothetical protein